MKLFAAYPKDWPQRGFALLSRDAEEPMRGLDYNDMNSTVCENLEFDQALQMVTYDGRDRLILVPVSEFRELIGAKIGEST